MSEAVQSEPASPVSDLPPNKTPQVETMLKDILGMMDYPATLEFQDMPDGALGVALRFTDTSLPGISQGRRSYLVDCLQFLVNKAVNRPNTPRRWVSLGVNAFPEPRASKGESASSQGTPSSSGISATKLSVAAPLVKSNSSDRSTGPRISAPVKSSAPPTHAVKASPDRSSDEKNLNPSPDAASTRLATTLASKSVSFGRTYGVMLLSMDDRSRFLKATSGVRGVTVFAEGEGHWRRVVFRPDTLTPISRKLAMPDYDEDA